jgi:hypothetical protein
MTVGFLRIFLRADQVTFENEAGAVSNEIDCYGNCPGRSFTVNCHSLCEDISSVLLHGSSARADPASIIPEPSYLGNVDIMSSNPGALSFQAGGAQVYYSHLDSYIICVACGHARVCAPM